MASPSAPDAGVRPLQHGEYHPLEIIPAFRRFKPGVVRDIAYTFIWNAALGFIFWLIAITIAPESNRNVEYLVWNMIVAQSIGYTIHALFELLGLLRIDAWARSLGWAATSFYYSLVSAAGVVMGFGLVALVLQPVLFVNWLRNPRMVVTMAASSVLISVILSVVLYLRARHERAMAELEREKLRGERVEREAVLANLRALQAQIEPHFLFNTLANVASLIDPEPAKARHMLESFVRFLRSSLAATRTEATTLRAEAELIAAYLEVLQVRMGPRLRFSIAVPPELDSFALPPMLLQPVVENAIRHGLEPKMDGGTVAMRARREGPHVVVEVEDTGVGFSATTRGGVGLANLRERLRLLYGDRAALEVGDAPGGGAAVRVKLPA
jgi:sensor histidine kinase YesM